MCVGRKIKKHLHDFGITQTYVSKKTGIPLTKLNLSLNGKRRLSLEEYALICETLNIDAKQFLTPNKKEAVNYE